MSTRSPSARSLEYLRELGHVAESVERWIPGACIRKDYLGIFDILVLEPGRQGVTGIQVTTTGHMPERRKKMQEAGHLSTWLAAGNRALIHGWAKTGRRGERKTWTIKIEEVAP